MEAETAPIAHLGVGVGGVVGGGGALRFTAVRAAAAAILVLHLVVVEPLVEALCVPEQQSLVEQRLELGVETVGPRAQLVADEADAAAGGALQHRPCVGSHRSINQSINPNQEGSSNLIRSRRQQRQQQQQQQ